MVGFRCVSEYIFYRVLEIRGKTALTRTGELICYKSIKSCATRGNKHAIIGHTVIATHRFAVVNHLNGARRNHRNAQVTSKTVSTTDRNNTQRRVRVAQAASYFIHCPVTADCHNCIKTHHRKLMSQLARMTCILCKHDVREPLIMVQFFVYQLRHLTLDVLLCSRYWVDDKGDIFHTCTHLAPQKYKFYLIYTNNFQKIIFLWCVPIP